MPLLIVLPAVCTGLTGEGANWYYDTEQGRSYGDRAP